MKGIRQAILVTTAERYVNLTTNFLMTVVVSRLLTPAEFGIWAIGVAIATIALSAREFAASIYIVQKPNLTRHDVRGAFTVMLIINASIAAILVLLAPLLAAAYGEANLVSYLRVAAVAILVEVVAAPLFAVMRRDLEFATLAVLNVGSILLTAVTTIVLVLFGFSYMSFAWGWCLGAAFTGIGAIYARPDVWVFRPLWGHWEGILKFSGYNGISVLLFRVYEMMPYFTLARVLSLEAAGLYNRALLICQLPDKLVLGGAGSVILPTFSSEFRAGRDLTKPDLQAVSFITVLQWPALIVLAILAHPIVSILLGEQWGAVVPIVQIVALATTFSFTAELNYPVLVSVGAMQDVLLRALIAWPISALAMACASWFGLTAAALSLFLIIPFQAYVSIALVQRHIAISWRDLIAACAKSASIAGISALGPLVIVVWLGFDMGVLAGIAGGVLAAIGWVAGLWLLRHPMLDELVIVYTALRSKLRNPIQAYP